MDQKRDNELTLGVAIGTAIIAPGIVGWVYGMRYGVNIALMSAGAAIVLSFLGFGMLLSLARGLAQVERRITALLCWIAAGMTAGLFVVPSDSRLEWSGWSFESHGVWLAVGAYIGLVMYTLTAKR